MTNITENHAYVSATAHIMMQTRRPAEDTSSSTSKNMFTHHVVQADANAQDSLPESNMTADELAIFFRDLDDLIRQSGQNKNEQTINLITACIGAGIDTRGRIIGVAADKRFHRDHVVSVLKHATGNCPSRHRWRVSQDGRYSLLD